MTNSHKHTVSRACWWPQDADAVALGATDANAIALPGPPSAPPSAAAPGNPPSFTPAAAFNGAREGQVFKTGLRGTGYYTDGGLPSSAAQPPAAIATTGVRRLIHCRPCVLSHEVL